MKSDNYWFMFNSVYYLPLTFKIKVPAMNDATTRDINCSSLSVVKNVVQNLQIHLKCDI